MLKGYSNPSSVFDYFVAEDVFKKWGGKNKYVMIDSCYTLRDWMWGNALSTSHGILGWTSTSSVRTDFPDTFFGYAISQKMTIKNAYKLATLNIEKTDEMNASIITKTEDQFSHRSFSGTGNNGPRWGSLEFDGLSKAMEL